MAPIRLILSFLLSVPISTPTNAVNAKNAVISNSAPAVDIADINAVTVVPMFAPIISEVACVRVISPTFTKPTIITVVAEELVTIAVTAAPVPTPRKRFLVAFAISLRIDLPAAVSRLPPITFIPMINVATPPNSNNIQFTIVNASDEPSADRLLMCITYSLLVAVSPAFSL